MKTGFLILLFILLLSGLVGCSGSGEPTSVDLQAEVGTDGTYLVINNKDAFVWNEPKITINGSFVLKTDFLATGKSSVQLTEFAKSSGERFDPQKYKLTTVTIYVPDVGGGKDGFYTGKFQ